MAAHTRAARSPAPRPLRPFFQPIQQLVQQYNLYQQGQAAITKINELLTTTPSVQESDDAETLPPINGDLVLTDVTFGYPDGPLSLDHLGQELTTRLLEVRRRTRGHEQVEVGVERARVAREVLAWPELQRVEEDRHEHVAGPSADRKSVV